MKFRTVIALTVACLAITVSASADPFSYTNGVLTSGSWNYAEGEFLVTDSFPLSNPSTLDSLTFPSYVLHGDTPQFLSWGISTFDFGSNLGFGFVSVGNGLTASLFCSACGYNNGYDGYTESLSLGGLSLAPGTYWLTLSNGTTVVAGSDNEIFWGESDGPSSAAQLYVAPGGIGGNPIPSEAFTISGTSSSSAVSVPEPETDSLLLFGVGLLGVRGLSKKLRGLKLRA